MNWKEKFFRQYIFAQLDLKNIPAYIEPHTYDKESIYDELRDFHILWYKWKNAPKYHVPQEQINELHETCYNLGKNILELFQEHLLSWLSTHYYKDKSLMAEKRAEWDFQIRKHYLEEGEDENATLKETLFEYNHRFRIPWQDFSAKLQEILTNDQEAAETYFDNLNQDVVIVMMEEGILQVLIYPLDENGEPNFEEEPKEKEITQEDKYNAIMDLCNNPYRESLVFDMPWSSILNNNELYRIAFGVLKSVLEDNIDYMIQTWENNKSTNFRATKEYDFEELSDLVEEQAIRNQQALQSNNLDQIASAISLTLNLKHNFGNLVADHLDLDQTDLDKLSNLDVTEAENELKALGTDTEQLWSEDNPQAKSWTADLDLQQDYYKQKELKRLQEMKKKYPDMPESMLAPWKGASKSKKHK